MNTSMLNLSSPQATSGSGYKFETKVQAVFTLCFLVKGEVPCLSDCEIKSLCFQGKQYGYFVDDIIVKGRDKFANIEKKLLVQIKQSISFTKSNKQFVEVIHAAWNDFNNKNLFQQNLDSILLITNQLSKNDVDYFGTIFDIARTFSTFTDFNSQISKSNLINSNLLKKITILREIIEEKEKSTISDIRFFDFLRSFYVCGFDLKLNETLDKSLILTITETNFERILPHDLWLRCCNVTEIFNVTGGIIDENSIQPDLVNLKRLLKNKTVIPKEFDENVSIPDFKNVNAIIKFSLIGSWNEINTNDKKKMEDLFHHEYSSVKNELYSIQNVDKSFINKDGSIWICNKNDEIKKLLLDYLSEDDLKEIKPILITTLSEINPQYNLPKEKRYLSIFSQTENISSKNLKDNLVNTLIFLWHYRDSFTNIDSSKIQTFISEILCEILSGKDWKIWASLNDYIPDFAEIAPETYLRLLQIQLIEHKSEICALFDNEGDGIFSGTLLSGILWGLEKLSFYEKYFPSTVPLLALLHQYDKGGRFTNRPFNSLHELFLPWIRQTLATNDVRINVLKRLTSDYPELGNKLLIDVLQKRNTTSNPVSLPVYDNTITSFSRNISKTDFRNLVEKYSEILLEKINKKEIPLSDIINNLDSFYSVTISKIFDFFEEYNVFDKLDDNQKYETWYSLNLIIRKHKYFKKSDWAFPNAIISKLEDFSNLCKPTNVLKKYKILFSEWSHDLYNNEYGEDYSKEEKDVLDRRISALREIITIYGIEIIYSYIDSDLMARNIAITMSAMLTELDINMLFPDIFNFENENIKSFYSYFLRFANNELLLQKLNRTNWNDNCKLELFIHLNFENENWELAEKELKTPIDYWKLINHLPLQSQSDLTDAISRIMVVKRYDYALLCFFSQLYNKREINNNLLLEALVENNKLIDVYDLHELIKYCQNQKLNHEKMILIEWKYLTSIHDDGDIKPVNLFSELQANPEFFIEILSFAFREEGDESEKNLSETEEANALSAYNLLHKWKVVPGFTNNKMDEDFLKKWITEVQKKANNVKRLSVANLIIGHVLFYSPADSSGLWINKTVAEILNKIENLRMRDGFYTEAINSRGAYSIDYTGKAEVEIANSWKSKAEALKENGYYELSTTLMDLYNFYINESERAKLMKKPGNFTFLIKNDEEE